MPSFKSVPITEGLLEGLTEGLSEGLTEGLSEGLTEGLWVFLIEVAEGLFIFFVIILLIAS